MKNYLLFRSTERRSTKESVELYSESKLLVEGDFRSGLFCLVTYGYQVFVNFEVKNIFIRNYFMAINVLSDIKNIKI